VPLIADRVVVLSEQGRVVADGDPAMILADTDLLLRANLIHEHLHRHGPISHSHRHHTADQGHLHEPEAFQESLPAVAAGDGLPEATRSSRIESR
jgi:cobalt/nickel transport system ATP-binding protein